jgi:glucose/arabinose dehydrogenase
MAVTGMHFAPVSGIEYVTEKGKGKEKGRCYVTSIVFAGNYGVGGWYLVLSVCSPSFQSLAII